MYMKMAKISLRGSSVHTLTKISSSAKKHWNSSKSNKKIWNQQVAMQSASHSSNKIWS